MQFAATRMELDDIKFSKTSHKKKKEKHKIFIYFYFKHKTSFIYGI